jgi:hypothetical protein
MKKLITPFVLLALTLAAAPPVNPTLIVTCSNSNGTTCSGPTYDVTGLDPTVSYQIDNTSGPAGTLQSIPIPSGSSTFHDATNGLIPTGSYTFELHEIGKNGNEKGKVLASDSPTF